MRNELRVILDNDQEFVHGFDSAQAMSNEEGRIWLDQEFVRLDCEPLRASGKVLIADKVLVLAREAGESHLNRTEWLAQFAAASVGALGRPLVVVDTKAMAVRF